MTRGVRQRIDQSRSVILAGYLYAEVAEEAWQRQLREFLGRLAAGGEEQRVEAWQAAPRSPEGGGDRATLVDVFRWIAQDLEAAGEAMEARDRAFERRLAESQHLRQRRDRLAKGLYRELSWIRRCFNGLLGYEEGCAYLDLAGPTPRDPADLVAWAQQAAGVLGDSEKAPVYESAEGGRLATPGLARLLAERGEALQGAIMAVHRAVQAQSAAREARLKAIATFDQEHKWSARTLESVLDYFGLPSLASTVRPEVKRRGRPPKETPIDAYPDLVRRVLGEELPDGARLEAEEKKNGVPAAAEGTHESVVDVAPEHEVVQAAKERPASAASGEPGDLEGCSKAANGSPELEADPWKIDHASPDLSGSPRKNGNSSRELAGGAEKSENALPEALEAERKIEKRLRKSLRPPASHAFAAFAPAKRYRHRRHRVVLGLDPRRRGSSPRPPLEPQPDRAHRTKTAESPWWQRWKGALSRSS
ncbi:MAG: hypothetical protein AAF657_18075 [Acidobacteriota bacterium]